MDARTDEHTHDGHNAITTARWPSASGAKYTILLQSVLKGKASEVYLALKPEQTSDYQTVKETILKACELVPEAYRSKCRENVEFAREKERLFDKWCTSEKKKKKKLAQITTI